MSGITPEQLCGSAEYIETNWAGPSVSIAATAKNLRSAAARIESQQARIDELEAALRATGYEGPLVDGSCYFADDSTHCSHWQNVGDPCCRCGDDGEGEDGDECAVASPDTPETRP